MEGALEIQGDAALKLDVRTIIADKLVLLALAPAGLTPRSILSRGARDVLALEKDANPRHGARTENGFVAGFDAVSDVRKNNCDVAILHGAALFALIDKRNFGRFRYILVPKLQGTVPVAIGLARYGRRGGLTTVGSTTLKTSEGARSYWVLRSSVKLTDNRRQYAPAGRTPLEILRQISHLNQIVLRWSEKIESGTHSGDVDILVAASDVSKMLECFRSSVSTYPLDVYTDDGSGGFTYKSVPYYTSNLAVALLRSATLRPSGVRVADAESRFLAFCYHLMFHNKSEKIAPGTQVINRQTFKSPHYFDELSRLALCAERSVPQSFGEIETLLKDAGCLPSLDLIGFYSRRNFFLQHRYFDQAKRPAGLATFFVRDFGQGLSVVPNVRAKLAEHFETLCEGPVAPDQYASILTGIRGGNWTDPQGPNGMAKPVYWFVCWDTRPKSPSRAIRKKHPRLDNEHIRIKDTIRNEFGGDKRKVPPIIHSSDNALEALDHLRHLQLLDHPALAERIRTRS